MSAQKGRQVLIKVEDSPGSGTYTSVAGMRAKQFSLNNGEVDLSDADSDWQKVGAGFGLKAVRISGNGIFTEHATQKKIVAAVLAGTLLNYQMVVPGLGTFTGAFNASGIDMGANHDNELGFSSQFNSSGTIAFAAA